MKKNVGAIIFVLIIMIIVAFFAGVLIGYDIAQPKKGGATQGPVILIYNIPRELG